MTHIVEDNGLMERLASLVTQRNAIDSEIAGIIGRPALPGHLGEFVAAKVFNISLHSSASQKGSDGRFMASPLSGKTVDIKYTAKNDGLLNMKQGDTQPDFYLVLAGPQSAPTSSRGGHRPWVIEAAYLFEAADLVQKLKVKIGVATSVLRRFWDEAEIYPRSNTVFPLTAIQRDMLALFSE